MTFENADNIHNKKNESFEHRRSHDERMEEMPPRLRKQLELATELYEQIKDPTPDLEQTEINNRIMFLWSSTNEGTERSYSNIFAQIE